MNAPQKEHEFKASIEEDVYYPDHAPRMETSTFRKTKHDGKLAGDVCAITGTSQGIEYHHFFCEDALMNAVDWHTVKKIGIGEITVMRVVDPETGVPLSDERGVPMTYPVARSLIGMITGLAAMRGFDWHTFDPDQPETFVDSPANMLVLHEKYHRAQGHGMHHASFPVWIFQSFPRKPGFVYMPDELLARHKAGA